MPYRLKGLIGVPDGSGPFPLVIIFHGSHSNDDESLRFGTGYDYLVEALAGQGIVTASLDISKAYIWKYEIWGQGRQGKIQVSGCRTFEQPHQRLKGRGVGVSVGSYRKN